MSCYEIPSLKVSLMKNDSINWNYQHHTTDDSKGYDRDLQTHGRQIW